jgi:dethiobiotin synthetase/adenosylmethionine--8-amino-7-oxononanoate aminotransferase
MESKRSALYRSLVVYQLASGNVKGGKTLFSGIVCNALRRKYNGKVWYMKAALEASQSERDNGHIRRFIEGVSVEFLDPYVSANSATLPSSDKILSMLHEQLKNCAQAGDGVMLLETSGGIHSPLPSGISQVDLYRPLRLPVILVERAATLSISTFESLHIRGYDVIMVVIFREADDTIDDPSWLISKHETYLCIRCLSLHGNWTRYWKTKRQWTRTMGM